MTAAGGLGVAHWLELAKRTTVAFIFGFLISLLFVLGSAANLDPIKQLEQSSVDLAARLATGLQIASEGVQKTPDRAAPIVMIDLDAKACAKLGIERECQFDRVGQAEVFTSIINSLGSLGPAAIVMDVLLEPEIGQSIAPSLAQISPPILFPMDLREGEKQDFYFGLEKSFCGQTQCGRHKFLPAMVVEKYGRSRIYPYLSEVTVSATAETEPTRKKFPTLAFEAANLSATHALHETAENHEISFSIPSFALADDETLAAIQLRHGIDVRYLKLSNLMSDDGAQIEWPAIPANSIVIIGSSQASARDLHNTPIGPMAGMEVLANAIRSMQLAEPEAEPTPLESFYTKIEAVFFALIIIALGEFALLKTEIARAKATEEGRNTVTLGAFWDRYSWGFLGILLAILIGEMVLTLQGILSEMEDPASRAGAIDVIWPVVGVLLASITALSANLVAKIEWLVEWGIGLVKWGRSSEE